MTAAQRFRTGLGIVLCSALIYAWHNHGRSGPTLFDLLWHGGLLLIGLALMVPPAQYQATLNFLRAVLRPRGKAP